MHTRAEPGIDTNLAESLDRNFTWQLPLIVENITDDVDPDMRGIEDLTPEELEAELDNWEAKFAAEKAACDALPLHKEPADIPLVYDLEELAHIDSGTAPTAEMILIFIQEDATMSYGTWRLSCSQKVLLLCENTSFSS